MMSRTQRGKSSFQVVGRTLIIGYQYGPNISFEVSTQEKDDIAVTAQRLLQSGVETVLPMAIDSVL